MQATLFMRPAARAVALAGAAIPSWLAMPQARLPVLAMTLALGAALAPPAAAQRVPYVGGGLALDLSGTYGSPITHTSRIRSFGGEASSSLGLGFSLHGLVGAPLGNGVAAEVHTLYLPLSFDQTRVTGGFDPSELGFGEKGTMAAFLLGGRLGFTLTGPVIPYARVGFGKGSLSGFARVADGVWNAFMAEGGAVFPIGPRRLEVGLRWLSFSRGGKDARTAEADVSTRDQSLSQASAVARWTFSF